MRVAFLFNAQDHQILHALPIACELSRLHADIAVEVLARTDEQVALCRRLASLYPGHRLAFGRLRLSWPAAALERLGSNPKALVLWANRTALNRYDALVAPERTSLMLRDMGVRRPLFIHTAHGAGGADRPHDKRLRRFDLLLMPNERRLADIEAAGNARPGRAAVIGGVKLDLIRRMAEHRPRLFDNARPTVIYNPHHRAGTSSWPLLGRAVLDHFANSRDYNLVFAPHVRLFDPPRRHRAQFREYEGLDHLRIDLGSTASIDMTYTLGADIYLGDLSSQVMEFLIEPRPCIFLDPARIDWRDDPDFVNWHLGRVVDGIDDMAAALARRSEWQPRYADAQRRAFTAAFPDLGEPAPTLGARAIAALLRNGHGASAGIGIVERR